MRLKMDPFEFRRSNIGDKRWLGVLDAAAEAAEWKPRVMASSLSERRGRDAAAASGSARTTCPMARRWPTSRSTSAPA